MIRRPETEDAELMNSFFVQLDTETKYMLFESGERIVSQDGQEKFIENANSMNNPLVLVALEEEKIVGFCGIRMESLRKNRHSASLVMGVLESYRGKGIGFSLLKENIERATKAEVKRIELTVVQENEAAVNLYKKVGFKIEGLREKSLKIDGRYHSEYYMSLLL